jgi:hypothetical protein
MCDRLIFILLGAISHRQVFFLAEHIHKFFHLQITDEFDMHVKVVCRDGWRQTQVT